MDFWGFLIQFLGIIGAATHGDFRFQSASFSREQALIKITGNQLYEGCLGFSYKHGCRFLPQMAGYTTVSRLHRSFPQGVGKKILDANISAKEQDFSIVNLVQPEDMVGVTEVSSLHFNSGKGAMPEISANTSAKVDLSAAETQPEIKMSRRNQRIVCETK